MTSRPSSRVLLQLETTPNTKPACSAAEIRGRTAFWLLIGRSGELCKSSFWENSIDRLLFRSIDFGQIFDRSTFQGLRISSYLLVKFAIPLLLSLQKQKTQKLTNTLENNKAKGLTSENQGVQIHNIWHSSIMINVDRKILCFRCIVFCNDQGKVLTTYALSPQNY
jgi:type I site-specific restriction endonuclease